MKSVWDELDALALRMRACLAALDGAAPEDAGVIETFAATRRAFAQLGDLSGLGAEVPAEEHPRLRRALEDLARLNALLTVAAAKDKERLLERVVQARKARRMIDARGRSAPTGASCDVRG